MRATFTQESDSGIMQGMESHPPKHIAIIMDGNGRWAQERGLPRLRGHEAGAEAVRRTMQAARKLGVPTISLYAFSTENWARPAAEVQGLMKLLAHFLAKEEPTFHENECRFRVMGRRSDLSAGLNKAIDALEAATMRYTERQMIVCLSYGGRTEIASAARRIAEEVAAGTLRPDQVDEKAIGERLYLPDVPDPDLVLRTSGERRLSNFLLWESAYAEFLSIPTFWPDFGEAELAAAIEEFSRRKRRFGKV